MDWFVALAPLLALILILIFGFTGCGIDREGTGRPIEVNVRFFPTDDPAAPTQRVTVHLVPVDDPSGSLTSADFPPTPEPPVTGPDGSRSQRILFVGREGVGGSVTCSVFDDGTRIIESEGAVARIPPIPDGQKAVVEFTASSGATRWDPPTVMLMAV